MEQVIEGVEAECKAVEADISQLNRTQAAIREESATLKQANHAAKDRVATAAASLRQAEVTFVFFSRVVFSISAIK